MRIQRKNKYGNALKTVAGCWCVASFQHHHYWGHQETWALLSNLPTRTTGSLSAKIYWTLIMSQGWYKSVLLKSAFIEKRWFVMWQRVCVIMYINHIAKPLFSSADSYTLLCVYFCVYIYIYYYIYIHNRYRMCIHTYIFGVFLEARLSRWRKQWKWKLLPRSPALQADSLLSEPPMSDL